MSGLVQRVASERMTGVSGNCTLCGLFLEKVAVYVEVNFGPAGKYADTGNPLVALNRRSWVCCDCRDALSATTEEST
jgi:hypothetical protein